METHYSPAVKYGAMALLLDGCTVNGVSKFLVVGRNTVTKWQQLIDTAVHAHGCSKQEFKDLYLRRDYAARIKARTAAGQAGLLGGVDGANAKKVRTANSLFE